MPELTEYNPLALDQLEKLAADETNDRKGLIDTAWNYYDGRHRRQLKVKQGQPDDNVIINLVQKAVDQGVSMLFGELPTFETGPGEDTPEEEALKLLWQRNRAALFLHNLAVSGSLAGHCVVRMLPDEAMGVRFILLDPRIVSVFWRPDDHEKVTAYKVQWSDGSTDWRQDIVPDGDRWLVRDLKRERGTQWTVTGETSWPWSFAPLLAWQNLPNPNGYYGEPDLFNPGLNDAVNFVASNVNRILKHHAHPKTIGTGMAAKDVQETAVDAFWAVSNPDARISNLEMQSDLSSSMAFLEFLQGSFYSQHRAVDLGSMKDRIGQLTNFGLQTLFKDALDKLKTKQELYGEALTTLCSRALEMIGAGTVEVKIHWADPLPFNDVEEINSIKTEMELGILSKETAASLRGRDWALEQERMQAEETAGGNIGARLLQAFERGPGTQSPMMQPAPQAGLPQENAQNAQVQA